MMRGKDEGAAVNNHKDDILGTLAQFGSGVSC